MKKNKAAEAYEAIQKQRILETERPEALIEMLFEKACVLLKTSLTSLEKNDNESFQKSCLHALQIVLSLRFVLKTDEGDNLSSNLFDTYTSIAASLFKAKKEEKDSVALTKIYDALKEIKQAWSVVTVKNRIVTHLLTFNKSFMLGDRLKTEPYFILLFNSPKLKKALIFTSIFFCEEPFMPVAIGLIFAYGFIYYQIADTGVPLYGGFFEEVIFLFVAGGSLMCTLMRNSFMDFLRMLGSFGKFVYYSQPDQLKLVQEVVELANVNRRDGPIAMQNIEVANKDLRRAVDMVVDGTDSAIIETTLNTDIAITREREQVTVDMLKFWADVAPSFGMIGTMMDLLACSKIWTI